MKSVRSFAITALLVAIFLSLANWQWNRASDLKRPITLDKKIYPLEDIAAPGEEIQDASVNKLVSVHGKYLFTRTAKFTNSEKIWDVSLMETDAGSAILIVRGITGSNSFAESDAKVIGRYLPPQGNNTIANSRDSLSRIDSSLVVTDTALPLYAGFILAEQESPTSNYQKAAIEMGKRVPGYYWQHISYVIIWLLFAVVVLYLPRYQKKLDRR